MKLNFLFYSLLAFLSIEILYSKEVDEELTVVEEEDEDEASKRDEEETEAETSENELTEEIFDKLNVFRIRSEEEVGFITEMIDMNILQFYYVPGSLKSRRIAAELIKVNRKIDNLAVIMAVNCEEFIPQDFKHCQKNEYSADSFPKLRLFVSPENRYDSSTKTIKKHYDITYSSDDFSDVAIFNFIAGHMASKAVKLDEYTIKPFLDSDLMSKVILFTDKEQPGLIYKGLSANLYDQLLFGYVHKDEKEIVDRFKITKFPTLLVYKNFDLEKLMEEPEIKYYEGNHLNVERLKNFLQKYALPEKKYISLKRGVPEESGEDIARNVELHEINSTNYEEYFRKYNKDYKIMVLFNTKNKLKVSVKKYLVEGHKYFLNVFFNCKHEKEFCLEKFGVKTYPTLRIFEKESFDFKTNTFVTNPFPINPSSNSTFLEDLNEYLNGKASINIANHATYPFTVTDAKDRRKFLLISVQSETSQTVVSIKLNNFSLTNLFLLNSYLLFLKSISIVNLLFIMIPHILLFKNLELVDILFLYYISMSLKNGIQSL